MDRILRTLLFVPANSWRMITTAATEGGDAVILDLEDACPIAEKETGRIFARDSIPMLKEKDMDVFVRVNSFDTGLTEKDIDYVVVKGLDGIMLPKTESKEDILRLDQLLKVEEEKKGLALNGVVILPLLESPKGISAVSEIISAKSKSDRYQFRCWRLFEGDRCRDGRDESIRRRIFPDGIPSAVHDRPGSESRRRFGY